MKKIVGISVFTVCTAALVQANMHQALEHYLQSVGAKHNHPTVFHDQMAGHYVGGSLIAKMPPRTMQLATVQLPELHAGCGGIDGHMGALSHIKAEQFSALGKSILTQVPPVALDLALAELSPLLKDIKDHMLQIATMVNMGSIQSCEMAEALVGAIAPKTHTASQHICQLLGKSSGLFSDYAASRHGCGVGMKQNNAQTSSYAQVLHTARDKGWEDLLIDQKNIAWQALKKNHFFEQSSIMQRFLMSLTGTLVHDSTQSATPIFYPSLAGSEGFIHALLHGGTLPLYQCHDPNCLKLTTEKETISVEAAFGTQVKAKLNRLLEKARDRHATLDRSDQDFLEATHFPLYKFILVEAATHRDPESQLVQFADVISMEWLTQFLSDQMEHLRAAALALKTEEASFNTFDREARQALRRVRQLKQTAFERLTTLHALVAEAQQHERVLSDRLASTLVQSGQIK